MKVDLRTVDRLGLALGGGGALGAAHVGVLQVLQAKGIHPQIVVGTSAGAIAGAAFAAGVDLHELEAAIVESTWGDFGTFTFTPGLGVLDTAGVKTTISRLLGPNVLIEDLPLQFAAVATDLISRKAVLLDSGSVADAVAASISVPGLFRPSRLSGRILVDGGVVQNLPLEATFGLGATHVIGVRIGPEWDVIPSLRSGAHVHGFEIRSDVTMIRPELGARSQWVPEHLPYLVELGRVAAAEALADYPDVRPRNPLTRLAELPLRIANFFAHRPAGG